MRFCRAAAILAAMVSLLAGCAGQREIPFDHASAGNIKTIGVVTPAFPDNAAVYLASSVGKNLGLLGALVDASLQASREDKFATLLKAQNFSARDVFQEEVTTELTKYGYTVSVISFARRTRDYLTAYPKDANPKVDAYLDIVTTGYGYIAAGIGSTTPYRPGLYVKVKLVRAVDSSVLMEDAVAYNPINPGAVHAVTISADPAYSFEDFDHLTADPTKATNGLRTALEKSAQSVAELLK